MNDQNVVKEGWVQKRGEKHIDVLMSGFSFHTVVPVSMKFFSFFCLLDCLGLYWFCR